MKRVTLIILVVLIILGLYGVGMFVNRQRILAGERDVLLVNTSDGIYTFLSEIPQEDITWSYRIKGYRDELSNQQLREATEGTTYVTDSNAFNASNQSSIIFPEGDLAQSWGEQVATLSPEVEAICRQMSTADMSVYCLSRHITKQALAQNDESICSVIFEENFRQECEADVLNGAGGRKGLADDNGNGVIDLFENLLQAT